MALDFGRSDVTKTEDELLAGPASQLVEQGVTIASSAALVRGTVLGRVTTTGKYKIHDANLSDGTQTARAILAEDVDASSGDEEGVAYFAGHFNLAGITWKSNARKDDKLAAILELHDRGIYLTGYNEDILVSTHTSTTTTSSSTTTTTTA